MLIFLLLLPRRVLCIRGSRDDKLVLSNVEEGARYRLGALACIYEAVSLLSRLFAGYLGLFVARN